MRDFRVSRRRRVAAAALSGVLDIFLVLLLPAGPGTAVLEVGGLCGFRWPVAVWEVWVAGGSACLSEMPLPPPPPSHYPTPSVPIKAANVSSWLIMRYTSRAVCLQGSETPLCINRAPIHKIGGDVFTNLSTGGGFLTSAAICGWSFLGRGDFWPECIWKDKYHTDFFLSVTAQIYTFVRWSCKK